MMFSRNRCFIKFTFCTPACSIRRRIIRISVLVLVFHNLQFPVLYVRFDDLDSVSLHYNDIANQFCGILTTHWSTDTGE